MNEDPYDDPYEWDKMCTSNSFILAAYVLNNGEPWHRYLSNSELAWFYQLAIDKYRTMSNFRKASTDQKIMYLLSIARAVRMNHISSPIDALILQGLSEMRNYD